MIPNDDKMMAVDMLRQLRKKWRNLIIVDYTHPSAVLTNIETYRDANCNFVLGTTGEDHNMIEKLLKEGTNYAVISASF